MCGIAGWWDRGEARAGADPLAAMLDAVAHRGPDDRGVWRAPGLALGHVRLAILDPSARAHQPLSTADGQGVIAYNGEVYNFGALREELEAEGVVFSSRSDTEVVLQALHRWGPLAALPRLDGMFAFAYFDRRSRTLWLARDRLGIKPLFATAQGRRLGFASEIGALLADPAVPRRPDADALRIFLDGGRLVGPFTLWQDVETLEPGACWQVREASVERHVYFDVLRALDVPRLARAQGASLDAVAAEVEAELAASVQAQLVSDAPLATTCSGGVDSGLVSALALERRPDLWAYVADVVSGRGSERARAEKAAAHLGLPLRPVTLDREDLLRLWPEVIRLYGQPAYHESDSAMLGVARRCREDGVKVLLTGEGADELFGGYPWQARAYERYRRWRRLHWLSLPWRPRPLPPVYGRSAEAAAAHFRGALADEQRRRREAAYAALAEIRPLEARAFLANCLDDLRSYLPMLLTRMDRMGMGASVEARLPFLANHVADLALHLPAEVKYRPSRSKRVLKQVARKRLPEAVVDAHKRGFPVTGAPYQGCEALLPGGAVQDVLGWSAESLRRVVARRLERRRSCYRLVSAEMWLRMYLGGAEPEALGEQVRALAS
jgi:asparagine synthase (glutamine-hydrolysing)